MSSSFITDYLEFTSAGECPAVFHRWSVLTGMGAYLERNIHLKHLYSSIYPNMYTMLLGDAGSRKSTAIKLMRRVLARTGYSTFGAEKTSKEKFLADLANQHMEGEDILTANIFGDVSTDITPLFIAADEANDFFGLGNIEFISLLGSLWDWDGKYENKVKHGKSDFIPNPTISILGGNSATNFALAFPATVLGQGFFSRLLIIHGESNGKRIAFPEVLSDAAIDAMAREFIKVKEQVQGEVTYDSTAKKLLEQIYLDSTPPVDSRFISFHNRRFTHLLKLCMIVGACHRTTQLKEKHIIEANTYLHYAEKYMPKALGEFGKAKDSDVTNKVLDIINKSELPISLMQIWANVSNDLDSSKKLGEIITKLLFAEKIQNIGGALAPLKKLSVDTSALKGYIDFNYLTKEERNAQL
jgi:hypothetical protein